jgi:hypothetical protein
MVKNLLFLGLKYRGNLFTYCSNLPSFQSKFNVIHIPIVIYCNSTVVTKVMLLYNTESWYGHGMVVNYRGKRFYNIGPRVDSRCWCVSGSLTVYHFIRQGAGVWKSLSLGTILYNFVWWDKLECWALRNILSLV